MRSFWAMNVFETNILWMFVTNVAKFPFIWNFHNEMMQTVWSVSFFNIEQWLSDENYWDTYSFF